MTRSEAGRLGGKATVERYGRDHMAAIGSRGFDALARSLGYGGRRLALYRLASKGRVRLPGRDLTEAEMSELYAECGL